MRGRPTRSAIRQNIVEILAVIGKGYGYEIYKIYQAAFPRVTMRSIYYNLRKGLSTSEFSEIGVREEQGDYSWGPTAEKIYYSLGALAAPVGLQSVHDVVSRLKLAGELSKEA